MMHIISPLTVPFDRTSRAPLSAGLYAWYAKPVLSKADLREFIEGAHDLGQDRTRSALARHTARFDPQPRRLTSRANFGSRWRGNLIDQGRAKIKRSLLQKPPHQENTIDAKIYSATDSQLKRELLSEILSQVHPWMGAPLYIGMTNNLRRRLTEHVDNFFILKEKCARIDGYLNRLKSTVDTTATDFAHRAVAAEFSADNLFAVATPISSDFSDQEHRELLESAEWLLNRWYTPILGRK